MFMSQHTEMWGAVDEIAERIRGLGADKIGVQPTAGFAAQRSQVREKIAWMLRGVLAVD